MSGTEAFTRVSTHDCRVQGHVVSVDIDEHYEPRWVQCLHCDKVWKVVPK